MLRLEALQKNGLASLYVITRHHGRTATIRQRSISKVGVEHLLQGVSTIGFFKHAAHGPKSAPPALIKDGASFINVQLGKFSSVIATLVSSGFRGLCQTQGQDTAGRCTCYQIEEVSNAALGPLLQVGNHQRRYNASNTSPINRQHPAGQRCHPQTWGQTKALNHTVLFIPPHPVIPPHPGGWVSGALSTNSLWLCTHHGRLCRCHPSDQAVLQSRRDLQIEQLPPALQPLGGNWRASPRSHPCPAKCRA